MFCTSGTMKCHCPRQGAPRQSGTESSASLEQKNLMIYPSPHQQTGHDSEVQNAHSGGHSPGSPPGRRRLHAGTGNGGCDPFTSAATARPAATPPLRQRFQPEVTRGIRLQPGKRWLLSCRKQLHMHKRTGRKRPLPSSPARTDHSSAGCSTSMRMITTAPPLPTR